MAHSAPINPHAVVQKVWLEPDAEKFKMPCAISISGPSQSKVTYNFSRNTQSCPKFKPYQLYLVR